MKTIFEITEQKLIDEVLATVEYGVLALFAKKPYAVPVNFVYLNDVIYFHGSTKGKKMDILRENKHVSFNINSEAAIIPSYYSSAENLACPATTFFKSVTIDGEAEIVESRTEIVSAFTAFMEKLQPEGQYKPLDSEEYEKTFKGLSVVKININKLSAKFKFGQNLNKERFQLLIENLKKSGSDSDLLTLESIRTFNKSI